MSAFKKTNLKLYEKRASIQTADSQYWKKYKVPVLFKEFGPIDFIDVSPAEPYYYAVTSSVKVQVYNPATNLIVKSLSRFKEKAYGGTFRGDGRLLCAGGEENHVKLFDVTSKTLLRVFSGHQSAVHRCFFTSDNVHIASFSDDKSVCVWDIPTENPVAKFTDHTDYVRAGAVSPVSSDIVLSGGYDHSVCMYDLRTDSRIFMVDHGSPVESVLFLPTGGIFISAGGTEIRIWDALAGGRLLAKVSQHHKTITCLRLACGNTRLVSGSLDRHVKVYDIATYQVVHTLDYPSGILSLGLSPDDGTVVVGMVDGLVSVWRQGEEYKPVEPAKKANFRYAPDLTSSQIAQVESLVDVTVQIERPKRDASYDYQLRKYNHSEALDIVLKPTYALRRPEVTVAVMQELIRRKRLNVALAGRTDDSLVPILNFLLKHTSDRRFTRVLIDAANILFDVYEEDLARSPRLKKLLVRLSLKLKLEESLTEQLITMEGALELLLSGATVNETESEPLPTEDLQPSTTASSNFVINIT